MYELELPFVPPLDWESLAGFLGARAVKGIESVEENRYRRVVRLQRSAGEIDVAPAGDRAALVARVSLPLSTKVEAERRLRSMFDLDAEPERIGRVLSRSPLLRPLIRRHPGIRVPGCWDPFEIVVRAIVGQQVSVAGARTILGRIVEKARDGGRPAFPTAAELSGIELRGLGMPDRRAGNLRRVSIAVSAGEVSVDGGDECRDGLLALPGIGPWTVEYVAMRAFRDPDAFPDGDLVLKRAAGNFDAKTLRALAESWRPFRAYAAMLLWRSAGEPNA